MSVAVTIESPNIIDIQRAIKMLKLLPDIRIKISKEEEYIPNIKTRRAIKEVRDRKNLVYCNDIEDFWRKIDA